MKGKIVGKRLDYEGKKVLIEIQLDDDVELYDILRFYGARVRVVRDE